jgi:hypothetical protein
MNIDGGNSHPVIVGVMNSKLFPEVPTIFLNEFDDLKIKLDKS